jgi:hypothetical protein
MVACRHAARLSDTDLQPFVGKRVGDLLDAKKLKLAEFQFVDDPPGVLSELSLPGRNGKSLRIVLKRHSSDLFSEKRDWSPEAVRRAEIAEVGDADY